MADKGFYAKLGLKDNEFRQKLQQNRKQVNGFAQSVKSLGPMLAGAFSVGAIVAFGKAAVQAWDEQEKAAKKLLVALDGNEAAQRRLLVQANQMMQTTLFGDEQIADAQAMLAMLTKDETTIRKLMPLVADFAQAQNVDLATAAKLVAKSIGSSTNALGRYGIEVEGSVGSTERLNNVVEGLTKAFGGQAEAAATAGAGGISQLGKAWGELLESFGSGAGLMGGVIKWLTDFVYGLSVAFKSIKQIKQESRDESLVAAMLGDEEEVKTISAALQRGGMAAAAADKRARELLVEQLQNSKTHYEANSDMVAQLDARIVELSKTVEINTDAFKEQEESAKKAAEEMAEWIKKIDEGKLKASLEFDIDVSKLAKASRDLQENLISELETMDDLKFDLPIDTDAFDAAVQKYDANRERIEEISKLISQAVQNMVMLAVDAFGELIEAMIAGEEIGNFGAKILGAFGQFMVDLGKQMIVFSGIMAAFKVATDSLKWYIAIPLGIAMVAAGSVLKGMAKEGMQPMAEGGIVPAGFPGDTYPARLTSGEMVIPPHKLDSVLGGVVVMETKIRGEDIYLIQKKMQSKHNRYS